MQHKELGRDLLQKIYQPIEDIAAMESPPKVPYHYHYDSIKMHVKCYVVKGMCQVINVSIPFNTDVSFYYVSHSLILFSDDDTSKLNMKLHIYYLS